MNNNFQIVLICLGYIPIFLGLSFVLTYISLGIHFLVYDYRRCYGELVWDYILASVFFCSFFITHYFLKNYFNICRWKRIWFILLSSLTFFILIIIGGFALYKEDTCYGGLWDFGVFNFVIQICYLPYSFLIYYDYMFPKKNSRILDDASSLDIILDEDMVHSYV